MRDPHIYIRCQARTEETANYATEDMETNAGPPTSTERIGLCHGTINKIANPTHKGLNNPRG